jgi:Protein of unknown function (DUF1279)
VAQGADGKPKLDPEAVTKKWGLEAGLFNIFTSKEEAGQSGQSKGQQVGRQLVCAKCCAAVPSMQPPTFLILNPWTNPCNTHMLSEVSGDAPVQGAHAWKAGMCDVHASHGQQAKQLLKRYGSAYLITSISFAIVSFAACYALVSSGAAASYTFGPAVKLLLE